MSDEGPAPREKVETYRCVEIVWEKSKDHAGRTRVRLQCVVNGKTLNDDWIDGLRKKIDAALDEPSGRS